MLVEGIQVAQLIDQAVAVPGEDGLGEAHGPVLGVAGSHVGQDGYTGPQVQGPDLIGGGHAGGELVAVADLDVAVLGHGPDGAPWEVVGDEQASLLGDVHGVGAVLDAPGLAVDITDHAPDHDGVAFLDPQALGDGQGGGVDADVEGLAGLAALLADFGEVGVGV